MTPVSIISTKIYNSATKALLLVAKQLESYNLANDENTQKQQFIIVAQADNVAIALDPLPANCTLIVRGEKIRIKNEIARGHKFAIQPIMMGYEIIKYGFAIAEATSNIGVGEWVHTHNIKSRLENAQYRHSYKAPPIKPKTPKSQETFMGFRRKDGSMGIRNEIWIIPTVGCVSALANKLARRIHERNLPNIDGVYAFGHQFGCSQLGDDLAYTRTIIASLACHPNCAGVLVIGLGCENNNLAQLIETIPQNMRYKIKSFNAQSQQDEFEYGEMLLSEIANNAKKQTREPISLSELVIGVKCGGSDGFSGLSANPLVGRISQFMCDIGAKVIMTEIPEIFGAEEILYKRCANQEIFEKLEGTIDGFKQYFIDNGQKIYENPSPGNKDGGISTLEEKSIGAVQKGGNAIIHDVLNYAEPVKKAGLNLMNAPGNDAISSTALAASGAHMILFTTGRGTPLGFMVPTIKISSNTGLFVQKPHWIDFDAGTIIQDGNFEKAAKSLIELIIDTANGAQTKNEINEIREFAIWKNGVTL